MHWSRGIEPGNEVNLSGLNVLLGFCFGLHGEAGSPGSLLFDQWLVNWIWLKHNWVGNSDTKANQSHRCNTNPESSLAYNQSRDLTTFLYTVQLFLYWSTSASTLTRVAFLESKDQRQRHA